MSVIKKLVFVLPLFLVACSQSPDYQTLERISNLEQENEIQKALISCLEDLIPQIKEDFSDIQSDLEDSIYWIYIDFPDDYDELEELYSDANEMYDAINQAILELQFDIDWDHNYCTY